MTIPPATTYIPLRRKPCDNAFSATNATYYENPSTIAKGVVSRKVELKNLAFEVESLLSKVVGDWRPNAFKYIHTIIDSSIYDFNVCSRFYVFCCISFYCYTGQLRCESSLPDIIIIITLELHKKNPLSHDACISIYDVFFSKSFATLDGLYYCPTGALVSLLFQRQFVFHLIFSPVFYVTLSYITLH